MEEKEGIKINLFTLIMIFAIIIIVVLLIIGFSLGNSKSQFNNIEPQISIEENSSNERTENNNEFSQFTKDVIKENERIELINIKENSDGTVNLIFRKYILGDIPELDEKQYDELMENKEIELLGDTFVLRGNSLTNNKYTTFDIDDNKKLKSTDMTNFYIGTDEYYITTCNSDFVITDYTGLDSDGNKIPILEYELGDDVNLDYMSSGYTILEYEFNEKGELISISKSV